MTLLEYDRKNGTELAYSLYMYLICERNSIAASNTMFIHRNTLVYRLKKIDALVNIDYENFEERQYIILSYEMATGSRI
jgi:DNA-binding PucR family transcriptional regulator